MQKSADRLPKYHSCDTILADVFFDVLKSKDYQQLKPKPKTSTAFLEKIFDQIYDDFYLKSGSKEAKMYIELRMEVAELEYKMAFIKKLLAFILYTPLTREMLLEWVDKLRERFDIEINPDGDLLTEMQRVLHRDLGIMNNDLNEAKISLEQLEKEFDDKEFDFYESIMSLGSALPGNTLVSAKMTLSEYIAAKKLAEKINKPKP